MALIFHPRGGLKQGQEHVLQVEALVARLGVAGGVSLGVGQSEVAAHEPCRHCLASARTPGEQRRARLLELAAVDHPLPLEQRRHLLARSVLTDNRIARQIEIKRFGTGGDRHQ